jgi:hypothetical protein
MSHDAQDQSNASRGDAYDYLVSIYQDDWLEPALRLQAAKAALPFERAPLRGAKAAAAQSSAATEARRQELLDRLRRLADKVAEERPAPAQRERGLDGREVGATLGDFDGETS